MKQFSFEKKKRLVTSHQFKAVLDHNISVRNGLLLLYMAENHLDYPRLGISVGKSFGGAVERNRAKRLLREAFRQNQRQIPAGFDYLLMISSKWSKNVSEAARSKDAVRRPTFEQVRTSFLALVASLHKKQQNRRTRSDGRNA